MTNPMSGGSDSPAIFDDDIVYGDTKSKRLAARRATGRSGSPSSHLQTFGNLRQVSGWGLHCQTFTVSIYSLLLVFKTL